MQNLEQTIRERAYQLWMEEGCQDGTAETHWLAAQREVLASSLSGLGSVTKATNSPKKASRRTAPKKTRAA
jgi:DUF2934 family protein